MAQLDFLTSAPAAVIMSPPISTKADDAYRTISEVADELDVPQHVLRFWESSFPQVKPSRMRGGRRYYRPADVEMLRTIKTLLYQKGYTIKGAKEVIRGKQELADMPPAAMAAPKPQAKAEPPKREALKKSVDTQSLISELRVLKSMLASLL